MSEIKRILVAVDFDSSADELVKYAANFSLSQDASLTILHVEEAVVPAYDEELGVLEPNRMANLLKLRKFQEHLENIDFETLVLYGDPARVILDTASTKAVDLVVMGTHGRSGFERALLGSVAETVLRRATCPVLLVRTATKESTNDEVSPQQEPLSKVR